MNGFYPLRFAIYYTRDGWSHLLRSCIAPLIYRLEKEGECKRYVLYFCSDQGEHLRLELYLHPTALKKAQLYQTAIETFLVAHPTQRPDKPLPLRDSFFLDLPNNSVYINSFKSRLSHTHTAQMHPRHAILARGEISASMLEVFAKNAVDVDSLFNFYLCLGIVALAVFGNQLDTAAKVLHDDYGKLTAQLPEPELVRLKYKADKLINDNRDDLEQLAVLVEDGNFTTDTEWLTGWLQACRQMTGSADPLSLFRDINMFICQHINFHDNKWSTLGFVVIKRLISIRINQSIINLNENK